MRQIAFVKNSDKIQKLMLYESSEGVYVFGYDCLNDTFCVWDLYYDLIEDGLEYCNKIFDVADEDWIPISDPKPDCQHDFILPTKKENNAYQSFVAGKWIDNFTANEKEHSFKGLTGNERLFITGLIDEFDHANVHDKFKAQKILIALGIG